MVGSISPFHSVKLWESRRTVVVVEIPAVVVLVEAETVAPVERESCSAEYEDISAATQKRSSLRRRGLAAAMEAGAMKRIGGREENLRRRRRTREGCGGGCRGEP
jgi:hypothetical protein